MFYVLNQCFERKATFGMSNEVLFEFCVKHGQYWMVAYVVLWRIEPLLGRDLIKDNQYSRCYAIGG
jgi:hypothetical protein